MAGEKEALFWKVLDKEKKTVQCQLCPHFCVLNVGERGKCHVRENKKGKMISLVYGKPCSLALDPIEKKPLYHFLPGKEALSIATAGCNLRCSNCQNWEISQCNPEDIKSLSIKPEEVIKEAKKNKVKIISYTYTEPTIFYEYMLDIAKLARKDGIKNTTVTNGFINLEPLTQLCEYLDGSNIDLKSIDDEFYRRNCGTRIEPVLKAIKIMHEKGVWIELTNLLIPGLNDSTEEIEKLVEWIRKNIGKNVPLHFTAFYPTYKLLNLPPTPLSTLRKARNIALSKGLNYVYTGNLPDEEGNNTYCPRCKQLLIRREGYYVAENKLKRGKCPCGEKIAGVWE
ncbi:MAG: AmmeMemoRadiSam system radical SAM enzyme [Nanoarchaeota archaeon]